MITQYQVHSLLEDEIPQLAMKPYPLRVSLDVYASINYFTDYTKHALEEHNFSQAKKCFVLAENLYFNGDRMVRLLIENSFIYSFSSVMSHSGTEKYMLKSILPQTLYKVYKRQSIE
ncbi:MAG: hypothetical protein WKG06_11470 [Segetibacter sp.]